MSATQPARPTQPEWTRVQRGRDESLALYRAMTLVRQFEERCLALSRRGLLAGSIHLCIGQEAVAVGAAAALRPGDLTVATYRGHGHVLARGVDPYRALAEVLGRATGLCKGKGGSMHLTDVTHGVLPPNSIVGAGLPIATGTALAQLRRGAGAVTLCAFGEGTLNQGAAHEALNLAAIWALPVVFLCENNGYAEMTPAYETIRGDSFGARVAAYGIPTATVDGMDVGAVADAVAEAVARARAGGGPGYVEAATYRFMGHYQGDPGTGYRLAEEVERWRARDPIPLLRRRLEEQEGQDAGLAAMLDAIEAETAALLDRCEERALSDPPPAPSSLEEDLYVAL